MHRRDARVKDGVDDVRQRNVLHDRRRGKRGQEILIRERRSGAPSLERRREQRRDLGPGKAVTELVHAERVDHVARGDEPLEERAVE